jgi:hypothetical protein
MKLLQIQSELKAPKNQFNKFGNYSYRSCEDILEALKPLLAKHECTLIIYDEIIEVGGRVYVKATAELTDSDNTISASAYARESENKKGMDDAQITGSASSYARKYALNGLFLIDDTKDPDSTNKHDKEEKEPEKPILKEGSEAFEKAVVYLAAPGGHMSKIKEKYNVPSKTEQQLIRKAEDWKEAEQQKIGDEFDQRVKR